MKFHIVCDSSADLPKEIAERDDITVVPFYVSLDGKTYLKEGVDIEVSDLYKAMEQDENCYPRTSMPSLQDYIDSFMPFVRKKESVLCICLTQKFSGSYQAALNAAAAVKDEYPDSDIHVMDSCLVTALQGLFVEEAVRIRDKGLSMEEAVPLLEGIRSTGKIFFTTKDLKYLKHGGRIGKAASLAGTVLDLKPVLNFSDGELQPLGVSRGRKNSLIKVNEKFFKYLDEENIDLKGYLFGTGIGADNPDYENFKANIQKKFDETGRKPDLWIQIRIGATIGVHTGPYPIGLGILKKCDI